MKICRAIFIVLFTIHTYHTTHGPPLDEADFYRNIAFSTAYPQLEWIATILDEGYCTAFLIAHLMLFKRGHIRSQTLLHAVRTVIFASVATFALPLAFCVTTISLQYAHMDPKVTRDAWVAAEFVIVLGAYASCLAPTIRSEQLAQKALARQPVTTPEGSDLPPLFTPGRDLARRPGASQQGSFPAKEEVFPSPRCHKNNRDDLELGTLSLSHFKDSSPSSPPRPGYSDGIELMHTSPHGRSSFDEEGLATPSKCKSNGMAILLKSNSLSSMNDGRFNSTPHLLPTLMHANEPDVKFRLGPNLQTHPDPCASSRRRLGTPDKSVTFHFPAKKSSLPLLGDQSGSAQSQSQQVRPKSSDDKTLKDPEEKSEVVEEICPKAVNMSNETTEGTSRPLGTPKSLRTTKHADAKSGVWRSTQTTMRPWTASGATGEHSHGISRLEGRSKVKQFKVGTDFSWQPKISLDAEMPFAGNFLSSSPCRHSDSELRQTLRNDKQRPTHTSPSSGSKNSKTSDTGRSHASSDLNNLLSGTTELTDWTHALNSALPSNAGSAANVSPTSSSCPSSQLSPPNSSAGIIRRGKMLAINTARANKFLLRPGSASGGPARAGLDSSLHFKRRGDKESGGYSPTTSHCLVRWGGIRGAGPPCFGHIEISMQRTTRIDYACEEEEPEQACGGDLGVATGGRREHIGGQDWTTASVQREKRDVDIESW
ncbi:hypothetical protein BCV69DRAFT_281935 [Microstroma glucosiphilum]|uniref:Uncharacterized protein n=1 Tax=Pseudomicrostroma glucosiphilum TaxID=1684307 RepID=A0A316U9Z0_9BASI|nr:hypothetical protein BCV69DRAFT_281935 [Pseudomicrostroma glucosiphilum]PWN22026.1 hypothetical protein BCV69DRAFT_281935 [Pseudomicrostroma glucosiphilum]